VELSPAAGTAGFIAEGPIESIPETLDPATGEVVVASLQTPPVPDDLGTPDGVFVDCGSPVLPLDIAICGDAQTRQLNQEMSQLYEVLIAAAAPSRAKWLRTDRANWYTQMTTGCGIPKTGKFSEKAAAKAQACVAKMHEDRVTLLRRNQQFALAMNEPIAQPVAAVAATASPEAQTAPAAGGVIAAAAAEQTTETQPASAEPILSGPTWLLAGVLLLTAFWVWLFFGGRLHGRAPARWAMFGASCVLTYGLAYLFYLSQVAPPIQSASL
jgi:hypothetical protein